MQTETDVQVQIKCRVQNRSFLNFLKFLSDIHLSTNFHQSGLLWIAANTENLQCFNYNGSEFDTEQSISCDTAAYP